jgi:hypothetical protein
MICPACQTESEMVVRLSHAFVRLEPTCNFESMNRFKHNRCFEPEEELVCC